MISLPLENEQRKTCATHLHHLFKRKHLLSSFSLSLSWGQVADVGGGTSVEHVDKNYPLGEWMMSLKSHLPTLDTPFASELVDYFALKKMNSILLKPLLFFLISFL